MSGASAVAHPSCCSACDRDPVEGLPLTPLDEAIERIEALVSVIEGTETLPLTQAAGRIQATDLTSPMPLPLWDNSAVDGYAVRMADLTGDGPHVLPVVGRVAAGDDAGQVIEARAAVRIFTGAPMPSWADAVVMQEDCSLSECGAEVSFSDAPPTHAHIRFRGEDVPQGSVIIRKGTRLDARHIALASSVGTRHVDVIRPVRVAILATGAELAEPGQALSPGAIYDSNTPMLAALLDQPHISLTVHRTVTDDFEVIRQAVRQLAADHDLLLTSGGMSVGEEDYIRRVVETEGCELDVKKVAMKPGKPLGFGRLGRCLFIGLPGNPFAALTGFLLFARPAIADLCGMNRSDHLLQGRAAFSTRHGGKRIEFVPARISGFAKDGLPRLEKLGKGGSARLNPLIDADGLAALPIGNEGIKEGARLAFYPFHAVFGLR
ncbi:molybdopterin molybdotransferase MoeA [Coralliovum pocilloporae]|uniref:molybdopterin molybdotransferase MoeA n=1 Tax=Coralliovum pocilloporae TaxID=3066369 RepID=UPI003306FD19